MTLQNLLLDTKAKLEAIKKNHNDKKANKARQAAVNERVAIMNCSGQLTQSLMQFNTTIRQQAIQIQEGKKFHYDTQLQEQELWDAAIGYMLVKDAQFALKSLYSYDSVEHAYNLLHSVTKYMNGNRLKLPRINGVFRTKDRNVAGYLTSEAEIKEKEELLDTFFEELKRTGNIEQCLETARTLGEEEGREMFGTVSGRSGGSGGISQSLRNALESLPDTAEEAFDLPDPTSIDVRVPTVQAAPVDENSDSRAALDAIPDDAAPGAAQVGDAQEN